MSAALQPIAAPPGLPLLGHLPALRRDQLGFFTRLAALGDAVRFRSGPDELFVFFHPDLIQEVLVTKNMHFHKSRIIQRMKPFLGEGLLTSEAPQHLRQRRLAQPAFARERLIGYGNIMVEEAVRLRDQWQPGQVLDIDRQMMALTLSIVTRTLFTADIEGRAAQVGHAMDELLGLFPFLMLPFADQLQKLPFPGVQRARRAQQLIENIIYHFIRERRASGEDKGDLLSMLLLAKDEEGGPGLTDKEVRDEAVTLFLAGHETTANLLTWTWYLLSQHPHVEERLHAEWRTVLGGQPPTPAGVPRLPYTEQVLAESMRFYPPAWATGRMSINEVLIGPYHIRPGQIIVMPQWHVHRDARWYPDPERFDPDRWAPGLREQRPKFAYFPFGGGPRLCIGERFAWMEGVLVLATLGQRWRLQLAQTDPVLPKALVTLRVKGGLKMRVAE